MVLTMLPAEFNTATLTSLAGAERLKAPCAAPCDPSTSALPATATFLPTRLAACSPLPEPRVEFSVCTPLAVVNCANSAAKSLGLCGFSGF
jgi:hypothetical protein